MTIDAFAREPHFIHHLAPIWRALPNRGHFYVPPELIECAASRGVQAEASGPVPPNKVAANTNPDGPLALVASYGDLTRARRRGYGSFIFVEHGIGQSYGNKHGSYPGGMDRDDVSLFLAPNEYAAAKWRSAYPRARVEVIGCPKLDDAPRFRRSKPPLVAISFHWDAPIAPEARGAFGYYRKSMLELTKSYTLLGHGHPRILPHLERYYAAWGIEIVRDFADVLRRASVLVADNTSALYEFAATGRPVVVLNQPSYRKDVDHGLRFWEAADVGIQVDHPDDLASAIEVALLDPPALRANREAALDLVYAYRKGAAQRAVEAILEVGELAA